MQKPKLSIFLGESDISALKYVSPNDYEFDFFPFSPSSYIQHNKKDYLKRFVEEVINHFIKKFGLKSGECEILIGNINGNKIQLDNYDVIYVDGYKALNSIYNFSWLVIDDFGVYTPGDFFNFFPLAYFGGDTSSKNYFSNKSLFSYAKPAFGSDFDLHKSYLRDLVLNTKHKYDQSLPIIFSGGFFTKNSEDLEFEENKPNIYLAALSFLKDQGIYEVGIDIANKLPTLAMLNYDFEGNEDKRGGGVSMLTQDIFDNQFFPDSFLNIGTVLRSFGKVSCLFENEVGNPQFVELDKNDIFIFPLEESETARVLISGNSSLGKFEATVSGGSLGFIVDTREPDFKTKDPRWKKVFKEREATF